MKKVFEISLLILLCFSLCACPYSSAYYLDEVPAIYVEDALIGKWITVLRTPGSSGPETINLIFSKRTDTEYNISFTGDLESLKPFNVVQSDSISGTAFMSTVGGNQFLNIKIYARVYIAELKLNDNKLSLLPLAEHFTGKIILNSAALRNSVNFHYKTRIHPILDDDFCLRDMVKENK